MDMDENVTRLLEKCDPSKQETLDSENVPDPMDAEQTWPTEEEMQTANEENKVTIRFSNNYIFYNEITFKIR